MQKRPFFSLAGIVFAAIFTWNFFFVNVPVQTAQTLAKAEAYGIAALMKEADPDAKVILMSYGKEEEYAEIISTLKANGIQNLEFVAYAADNPLGVSYTNSPRLFAEAVPAVQNGDIVYVRYLQLDQPVLMSFFKSNPDSKVIMMVEEELKGVGEVPGVIAQVRTNPKVVQEKLPSNPQKAFEQGFLVIR